MIVSRLLEAVSEPCVKQVQRITLEAAYKEFTLTISWGAEVGWRGINGFLADSKSEEQSTALPELQKGEILKIKGN